MTDFCQACLLVPELDDEPMESAADIFLYFSKLDRSLKPTFVAYHNGKILATFTGGAHSSRCDGVAQHIHNMNFARTLFYASSARLSVVVWQPI